jgi:hypothetical protein
MLYLNEIQRTVLEKYVDLFLLMLSQASFDTRLPKNKHKISIIILKYYQTGVQSFGATLSKHITAR